MKYKLKYFLLIMILYYTNPVTANATADLSKMINIDENLKQKKIGLYCSYYEDKKNNLTISQIITNNIKWKKIRSEILNLGFKDSTYWVRFRVNNITDKTIDWSLLIDYPLLDNIDIFISKNNKIINHIQSGDHTPIENRHLFGRNITATFTQDPGISTFYIKCSTKGSMNLPLIIYSKYRFTKMIQFESYLLGIFIGIIIIIIIYNLILFFSFKDIIYLYYILFVTGNTFYQLALMGFTYLFFNNTFQWWTDYSIPVFIFLTILTSLLFSKKLLLSEKNIHIFNIIFYLLMTISVIGVILTFFLDYSILIRFVVITALLSSILLFSAGIYCLVKGFQPARFYVLGWTIFLFSSILYGIKTMGIISENAFINWGQQIGFVFQAIFFSLALSDKISEIQNDKNKEINEVNNQLTKRINEINDANKKIAFSEERYRMLIEGSNEMIFLLDEKCDLLSANRAFRSHFNLSNEELISKSFYDFIFQSSDGNDVTINFVKEKIDTFLKDKKIVDFKTEFISSIKSEPQELQVKLQYLNILGKNEILGRATSIMEDSLIKYFISETQRISIDNYLITAEDISFRITRNLIKYLNKKNINMLRIALREIIINAIEHGNLNINFEEKSKSMLNNTYFELVLKRRNDPNYKNRKVWVDYTINSKKAEFTIRDEGTGFNHKNLLENTIHHSNSNMLAHGRGLIMAQNLFDEISFNDKGNIVTLIKYLTPDKRT